ncbi:MAG: MraY family glycosyltransferase [Planctomycetota bacterium]|nr:MraY family glycosyltransferase [Planctomycetota bacterium]
MPSFLAAESLVGLKYFSPDQVLSPYVFVFYASYVIAFLFTPVLRTIAIHYGIIDEPDGVRKMHTKPVAYLGGVAVFLGWLSGLAISQFVLLHRVEKGMQPNLVINFGIVISACSIVLLGLWDDIIRMSPWAKIGGQILAAVCLVVFGIGRHCAWIVVGPMLTRSVHYFGIPHVPPGQVYLLYNHWIVDVASILFVMFLVVGCCNAANLMDGLDGLCGGVMAVVAAGFLFLAVNLATQSGAMNVNQDALRVVLGLALLGGVMGFVPYNFNPASIFMGDTGSMFLGFVCALLMILFASEGHFKWFLASMVMFSLPILDSALAFVRRWVNGRPLFSPDRYHLHHQLVSRGFSVKQTVVISYGLSIIFVLLGAAIVYIRARYAVAIYLIVFGSIIVAAYKMGMVHERVDFAGAKPSPLAEPSAVGGESEQIPTAAFSDSVVASKAWSEEADATGQAGARQPRE